MFWINNYIYIYRILFKIWRLYDLGFPFDIKHCNREWQNLNLNKCAASQIARLMVVDSHWATLLCLFWNFYNVDPLDYKDKIKYAIWHL